MVALATSLFRGHSVRQVRQAFAAFLSPTRSFAPAPGELRAAANHNRYSARRPSPARSRRSKKLAGCQNPVRTSGAMAEGPVRSIPCLSLNLTEYRPDGTEDISSIVRALAAAAESDPAVRAAVRRFHEQLDGAEPTSVKLCRAVLAHCVRAGLKPHDYRIVAQEVGTLVLWRTCDTKGNNRRLSKEVPGMPDLQWTCGGIHKLAGPVLSERIRQLRIVDPNLPPRMEPEDFAFVQFAILVLEKQVVRYVLRQRVLPESDPPTDPALTGARALLAESAQRSCTRSFSIHPVLTKISFVFSTPRSHPIAEARAAPNSLRAHVPCMRRVIANVGAASVQQVQGGRLLLARVPARGLGQAQGQLSPDEQRW
ncbi:hypothetical protein DFJ74DRAFT_51022 [Hyaloraphidium curvatum]|nr:hypothetical protein DFJ74DRAFT_51022 [Hyaloraphidium curvatum]